MSESNTPPKKVSEKRNQIIDNCLKKQKTTISHPKYYAKGTKGPPYAYSS